MDDCVCSGFRADLHGDHATQLRCCREQLRHACRPCQHSRCLASGGRRRHSTGGRYRGGLQATTGGSNRPRRIARRDQCPHRKCAGTNRTSEQVPDGRDDRSQGHPALDLRVDRERLADRQPAIKAYAAGAAVQALSWEVTAGASLTSRPTTSSIHGLRKRRRRSAR